MVYLASRFALIARKLAAFVCFCCWLVCQLQFLPSHLVEHACGSYRFCTRSPEYPMFVVCMLLLCALMADNGDPGDLASFELREQNTLFLLLFWLRDVFVYTVSMLHVILVPMVEYIHE